MNLEQIDIHKKAVAEAIKRNSDLAEPIMFYSTAGSFTLGITSGQLMKDQASGSPIRVGEKIIEFNPMGAGIKTIDGRIQKFGYYITKDPEVASKLLDRASAANPDILLQEDYVRLVKPAEQQITELESRVISTENELERLIAENKRLQAAMAAAETSPGRLRAKE